MVYFIVLHNYILTYVISQLSTAVHVLVTWIDRVIADFPKRKLHSHAHTLTLVLATVDGKALIRKKKCT